MRRLCARILLFELFAVSKCEKLAMQDLANRNREEAVRMSPHYYWAEGPSRIRLNSLARNATILWRLSTREFRLMEIWESGNSGLVSSWML